MRSGLWILLLVIVAGIAVGSLLKGRLDQPAQVDDLAALREISMIEDPQARIVELDRFLLEHPESEYRSDVIYMISGAMLNDIGDTSGMILFAERTLQEESDPETRALMYYRLYRATADVRPDEALGYARRLLDSGVRVGWVHNYIAYDYAEKGENLPLAVVLADRAIESAESSEDSASYLDTRGWARYRMEEYDQALMDLADAARIAPEPSAEVLGHLAQAQLKTGREDDAFETLRELLVMGEHAEARELMAGLMRRRGYTARQAEAFEEELWEERDRRARRVEPFSLPALAGGTYDYSPADHQVSVINFFSPT